MNKRLQFTCLLFIVVCGCAPKNAPKNTDPVVPAPDTAIDPQPASANDLRSTNADLRSTNETVTAETSGAGPENTNTFVINAADRSIWDGVYTEQQRQRGEAAYTSACVRCHKEDLLGSDSVPTLVGEEFRQRWKRKRAGNLFSYMKEEMPPKKKRTALEYADILAFLLSSNNAPAGEQELAHSFIELQAIRMNKND